MTRAVLEPITKTLCLAASARGEPEVPFEDALGLVTKYLPNLLEALDAALVTEREVAGVIADRFTVWLAHRSGRRFLGTDSSWDAVVDDVEAIVRARGSRTRP